MKIIREYNEHIVEASRHYKTPERRSSTCVLHPEERTKTPGSRLPNLKTVTFETLSNLFNAAQKDFPALKAKDVHVRNDSIYFTPPSEKIPKSYKRTEPLRSALG